jgi:hypothetical protein
VTAGIISAKARNLDASEFNLYTNDAAVNPGNSGGALINTRFSRYKYHDILNDRFIRGLFLSVPSNIAKDYRDIMEFGNVQENSRCRRR